MTPSVSILVPTYYSGEYIRNTVASLEAQDYPNLTIAIADDGSTDETCAVCEEWAARDPRITFRRNPSNLGAWGNFIALAERAESDFVIWACHDDTWTPDFVSTLVERLRDRPDAVAVQGATHRIRLDGSLLQVCRFDERTRPEALTRWELICHLCGRRHKNDARLKLALFVLGLLRRDVLLESNRAFGRDFNSARHLLALMALAGPFLYVDKVIFYKRKVPRGTRRSDVKGEAIDTYQIRRLETRFLAISEAWRLAVATVRSRAIPPRYKAFAPLVIAARLLPSWRRRMMRWASRLVRRLPTPVNRLGKALRAAGVRRRGRP